MRRAVDASDRNPVTTVVINLKGRIHQYGSALEHAPDDLVYVGRAMNRGGWKIPGSPLHNPFTVGTLRSRQESVDLYRDYLRERPDLLALLPGLRGKTLACWCHPEPCHADVLAELIRAGPPGLIR